MIINLDTRGLKPPEPMIHILQSLDTASPGDEVHALLDREPLFLYSELDERNVAYECARRTDGGFMLTVRQQ
ncbi:MAG: DUF2249 domain-containing protein [Vulcanimicrobiaceae bacterium]